ncbi:hypothetical protein D3C76_1618790 [compost metagenome]
MSGIRVAGIDRFQARQFGACGLRFAQQQKPAYLPGQAIGLQTIQAQLDRVFIQSLDKGEGLLVVARQPLHIPQHLEHAQH